MKIFRYALIIVLAISLGLCLIHLMLTGRLFPTRIEETLHNPQEVRQITSQGFVTSEGTLIEVPHVLELPTDSPPLRDAVAKGIEVDADGRVFGLLRIHHWCGNDPVRYHIARVNLSDLALAAGGVPADYVTKKWLADVLSGGDGLQYGKFGLSVSDYYRIQNLSLLVARNLE